MPHKLIKTQDFSKEAAIIIKGKIEQNIKNKGRCVISLCGGNTPKPVYAELANIGKDIDWNKVIITFGDERCVGSDDAQSNYKMVKEALIDKIDIPVHNVLRIRGEFELESSALEYEKRLSEFADSDHVVHVDIMLLGIGDDGHTASLFPNSKALNESTRLIVPNFVEKLGSWRITSTFKLINNAREVIFLVNDPKKQHIVDDLLVGKGDWVVNGVREGVIIS